MRILLLFLLFNVVNSFNFRSFKANLHRKIFDKITEKLPELHKSGDEILYNNEKLINDILENPYLHDDCKKTMVKCVLDFTIAADGMASSFLKMYRKMVDEIL